MSKIIVNGNQGTITINGNTKDVNLIEDHNGFLCTAEPLMVGARVGATGRKIWIVRLEIRRNSRWIEEKLNGATKYVLHAHPPLNSVNRKLTCATIIDWAENIPDSAISKR
jgi:hypothetical protein